MWRVIRIGMLLIVLIVVAGVTWGDRLRTTAWTDTLWIGVFPVDGDGRPATRRYIEALGPGHFTGIERFFEREAAAYGIDIERPVRVELYPPVSEAPPPLAAQAGVVDHALWSLRARWYAWRMAGGEIADVRVFVLYHDPEREDEVPHSVGLQKGLLGVVYAYAEDAMNGANNIVIAHEVLHALGATDKYDPASNLPLYPDGYADPQAEPRHPQQAAEIMAGRVALSPTEAQMPENLAGVVVGEATAREINWIGGE